jgi:hypothetical protein
MTTIDLIQSDPSEGTLWISVAVKLLRPKLRRASVHSNGQTFKRADVGMITIQDPGR